MSLAIVTGAARGIGRAIAERLRVDGYDLMLVDLSDEVKSTARELDAWSVRADVSDPAGVAAIEAALDACGELPMLLVNNAGITRDGLLRNMDENAFRLVQRVNLGGTMALTEAIAPRIGDGGAIVNISSRAQLGNIGQFNYGVSKGGVIGCTRAFALSFAPRLRVNAVAPGFVSSEMTQAMPEAARERVISQIPLGQPGQPLDIANAVAWLGSSNAAYVTGQVLYACGGRSYA